MNELSGKTALLLPCAITYIGMEPTDMNGGFKSEWQRP